MKKILASAVFVCILVVSFSANAETHRRFRRETLWHLLAVPAYALLNINIHEGLGHMFAAAMMPGMEVVSYRPYPHVIRNEDGTRSFVTGVVYVLPDECNMPSNSEVTYLFLAPYVADISIFIATDLMISLGAVHPRSQLGGMMYVVGMVGTWADFVFNLTGSLSPGNDFYQASQTLGIHPAVFATVGSVLAAVALWRVIRVGYDVFTESVVGPRRQHRRRVSVAVSPYVGDGGGGLAIGGAM